MLLARSTASRRPPAAAVAVVAVLLYCGHAFRGADALHFYTDGGKTKCFLHELVKDDVVAGEYLLEEWSETQKRYVQSGQGTSIQTVVEELPKRHKILNQKGGSSGKFSFTASETGDHQLCLTPQSTGWIAANRVRVHIKMDTGVQEKPPPPTGDNNETVTELAQLVRAINKRVVDIRRDQGYQRETEAKFRDQSEHTNSKVVYWAFCQLLILAATCVWQMRNLKGFFEAKKLV